MAWVCLGLGSSIDPVNQLTACLDSLLLNFQDLSLSSVFESESVGFDGDNFLNMAVAFNTDLPLQELSVLLKSIEDKAGRDRTQNRLSNNKLDIDILTVDKRCGKFSGITLPRTDILENAYVLWPLSQVNGKQQHPELKKTYKVLWQEFQKERQVDKNSVESNEYNETKAQKLWSIDFRWHGRMISKKSK